MTSRNRYITNSYRAFMTSTHFENFHVSLIRHISIFIRLFERWQIRHILIRNYQVYNSSRSFFKGQGLDKQVWNSCFRLLWVWFWHVRIDQIFDDTVYQWSIIYFWFECQWIGMLTYLAFKLLPGICKNFAHSCQINLFSHHFLWNPMLQTIKMNITHWTITLACTK